MEVELSELGHVFADGRDASDLVSVETEIAEAVEVHLAPLNWAARFLVGLEELGELVLVQFERAQVSEVQNRGRQVYQAISTDSELLQVGEQVNVFRERNYSWVLAKIKLGQVSMCP